MVASRLLTRALVLFVAAQTAFAATPFAQAPFVKAPERIAIGSKSFTESRLLAEIVAQWIEANTEIEVVRRFGLGGTLICFNALQAGELDIYPEYTGTAWSVILKREGSVKAPLETYLQVAAEFRAQHDLEWMQPFGLNNTYAIALSAERAAELGLERISDLAAHAGELRAGFSFEFMNREDGYPGLRATYGLEFKDVRSLDHGLVYDALQSGAVDVIDAYSTDAKLLRYNLRVLEDDRSFFPPYNAATVVRGQLLREQPGLRTLLDRLAFRLPDQTILTLSHRVEVGGEPFETVAAAFLAESGLLQGGQPPAGEALPTRAERSLLYVFRERWSETLALIYEHLQLTLAAVLLAALLAIPLGIWIAYRPPLDRFCLGFFSAVQTIPSLALLASLIAVPGLGLSARTAIVALFLYAVLPILRNTYTGLRDVDPDLIEAGRGMGLTESQIMTRIQLPLATSSIMAGLRTATVISVGVATLAAFIGAGGLGEPIVTGLYLNDTTLILTGAIPAALLALSIDFVLSRVERRLVPKGLEA